MHLRNAAPVLMACLTVLLMGTAAAPANAAAAKVTWLAVQDDPRLSRARLERAVLGQPAGTALDAFKVALSEASTPVDVDLQVVADAPSARAAAMRAEKAGHLAVVADLPALWLAAASEGTKLAVLNIGAAEDSLREADCKRNLLHFAPSERMKADALAQWLVARQ